MKGYKDSGNQGSIFYGANPLKGSGKNEGFCEERETCPTITSSFFEQNPIVFPHTKKVKIFQYPRGYNPCGKTGNECYQTVRQDNKERYTNAILQEGES